MSKHLEEILEKITGGTRGGIPGDIIYKQITDGFHGIFLEVTLGEIPAGTPGEIPEQSLGGIS